MGKKRSKVPVFYDPITEVFLEPDRYFEKKLVKIEISRLAVVDGTISIRVDLDELRKAIRELKWHEKSKP